MLSGHETRSTDVTQSDTAIPTYLYVEAVCRFLLWPKVCITKYYGTFFLKLPRLQKGLGGANPAVNTPRPSRGTRIESCDFIVLIGDP